MTADLPIDRSNSLRDLAARIAEEHEQVTNATRTALTHAITAGELLLEAKGPVGHGQWETWVKGVCKLPPRTASRYMLLAENRETIKTKSATVADLTVRAALRLLKSDRPKPAARPRKKAPPAALNSLAWSEAEPEARAKFIDGVGVRALWDAMTPQQRVDIVAMAYRPCTVKHSLSAEEEAEALEKKSAAQSRRVPAMGTA